jgi:hypothetical protein
MRRLIFALTTAALVAAAPTDAYAGSEVTRDDPVTTPISPLCRPFLREPRDAISVIFRWDQRLSFASCVRATTPITRPFESGDLQSLPLLVTHLEGSFATPIAIYRDAMAFGPPEVKILGAYGLASTYLEIAIRARSALAPDDTRGRFALEPLLEPTLRNAKAAFDEVGFLADDFPKAAKANAVVDFAIRHARTQARLLRD